jgi:hypothetical protein
MAVPVFLTLCGLSIGFLVYVLIQFWREARRPQGNAEPAIVFSRSSSPNLIVVTRRLSLSAQGGISVMPLQPQTLLPAGSSANSGCRAAGKARVLQMPVSGGREAQRDAAGASRRHNSLKVS